MQQNVVFARFVDCFQYYRQPTDDPTAANNDDTQFFRPFWTRSEFFGPGYSNPDCLPLGEADVPLNGHLQSPEVRQRGSGGDWHRRSQKADPREKCILYDVLTLQPPQGPGGHLYLHV